MILLYLSCPVFRIVSKQLAELLKDPPEGIRVLVNDEDISAFSAVIEGPRMYIILPSHHKLLILQHFIFQPVHLTSREIFTSN